MICILLTFIVVSYIENKLIYKICKDIEYSIANSIIVYLASIITAFLIYNKYNITIDSISYFLLIPFIVLISIIDFRTSFVYDITVLSGIIVQSALFILAKIPYIYFINRIGGLIVGLGLAFLFCKITKAIGEGDIGFYGLCCFVLGLEHSLNLFALSFLITSIFAIFIVLKDKRLNLKVRIPFTPFISISTVLIMITQYDIIRIYIEFLNNKF